MKPLLEIQSVPIAIEYKTSSASVQHASKVNRMPAFAQAPAGAAPGPQHKAQGKPDTFEYSGHRAPQVESRRTTSATVSFYDKQGNSQSATYSATARLAGSGQVMVDLQLDRAATASAQPAFNENVALPQSLSVTYQLEKMQYEMRQNDNDQGFVFTPAGIEFSVQEYPQVVVEYVGDPLYVPPSAAPDYEPIDTIV